jgi:hypothetical protein
VNGADPGFVLDADLAELVDWVEGVSAAAQKARDEAISRWPKRWRPPACDCLLQLGGVAPKQGSHERE